MDINVNLNEDQSVRGNGHKPAIEQKTPRWTIMVYLAGDNNLTTNCISVLQQLEAVKYKRNVRVLACFDSNTPWPKGSRYLAINCKWNKNNEDLDWEIYNDLIITEKRGHKINPPDFCSDTQVQGAPMKRTDVAEGLKRFMQWAMKHHRKSDPCMLVLYGHGPVVAGKTFLAQEHPVSSLTMTDIPTILKPHFGGERRKLEILAFQNCAMNGVETAWEVKDYVNYMIGSQGLVLSYGWPYERIMSALVDNPNDKPIQIAEKILKACARHLIDFAVMDRSSEQSVCDLSKLRESENITAAITKLVNKLKESLTFIPVQNERCLQDKGQRVLQYPLICDAVRLARLEAQTFWGETFVDVYDFCERLLKKCNEAILVQNEVASELACNLNVDGSLDPWLRKMPLVEKLEGIIDCCMEVMKRVEEMVPHSYYIGSDLQYSRGLSIYFPWSMPGEPYTFTYSNDLKEHELVTAFETYSRYDFVDKSGWAGFLKSFYKATLRKVRRSDREFCRRSLNESLSLGMVREGYKAPTVVLTTEYLQKTDSNSGGVDLEVWSNVKNYPRRNYLSPSDCPRKPDNTKDRPAEGSPYYQNCDSPHVSYLGWNICELVADVIRKKQVNGHNGHKRRGTTKVNSVKEAVSELTEQEPELAKSRLP